MTKRTARNGKIDLLKFLFSLCVILNHAKYVVPSELEKYFLGFSLSVEFFFLVSGWLLMASIEKAEKNSSLSLSKETGIFMLRKYKSLYPDVAVAYFFGIIIVCVFTSAEFFPLFEKSWFDIFLIISTGLRGTGIISVTWYVSSMLICMAVLYPFIRKYKDMALNIVLPVGTLLILGFMYRNYSSVRGPLNWNGFTYYGNLRAMAELSMGCLCYCLSKKLKTVDFSSAGKTLLAIVEFAGYGMFVFYMASDFDGLKDFFYIFILCISVIISFSGKSLGHKLFNNSTFTFLGKFSFPLYLVHGIIALQFSNIVPSAENMRTRDRLLIYLTISFASAVAVMLISKLIRKAGPIIISGIKKLTVKPTDTEEAV
ncbi:MAG: acyltransferase [Clostridia bacterium]|nr:acyltransferase [Clostridia bacterium]